MGGVRNGKSVGTPEPAAARQDAPRAGAPDARPEEAAREAVDRHLRSAVGLLREGSAARAFGELARASRTQPMTPRLAAALVRFALLAGTEAAAITLLEASSPGSTAATHLAVRRQLARVLRRVGQLPRAIASLEAILAELPQDRRAQRGLQVLRARLAGPGARVTVETPAGGPAPAAAPASEVLSKLPTRKGGVQVPAVWEDNTGSREKTNVDSPSDALGEPPPPEPRERTAVAFPSVASPEPRPGAESRTKADAAHAEPRVTKTETELPAVTLPASDSSTDTQPKRETEMSPGSRSQEARPTVMEMPAVDVASKPPPPGETRPTVLEMPAVDVAPKPPLATETRPTVMEMPAVDVAPKPPSPGETRPTVLEMPAPAPTAKREHISVPWPEPSPEEMTGPLVARAPPPRDRAWDADEDTGEVTSEAMPFLPGAEPPGAAPPRSTPSGEGAPRAGGSAPARAERTEAPASQAAPGPTKTRPAPAEPSPQETQEVSMADLEAALTGAARSSGATPPGAGSPRPGEASEQRASASTSTARAEGTDAPVAAQGRAGSRTENPEELTRSQKLEAKLIARQAWRELAQLYLKRADGAKDAAVRAEALTRLAEVMENELQDPAGAARMYREIVDLTGDRAALREQVRLLSTRGDASLVRRALDEAIQRARNDRARAGALLTRGERWLHMGEPGKARADFEAAEALAPGLLPVLAGLVRCVSDAERPAAAERLRSALAAAPRRAPDRLEGLRLLAQTAEESLGDPRMAQWAWTEVLAESPESEQARGQLVVLARKLGDPKALGHLLRAQLARESRGPLARQARLELVGTLEALGDADAALHELRQAVRYEPGHKEAWLLLVERLTTRGNMGEAAWALEHAATATEDEQERGRTWERLARFWRDVLRDPERAQVYARRAEGLLQPREEREAPPPEPPRGAPPRGEPSAPRSLLVPAPATLSLTPSGIAALANEVTSTTDPGAPPAAVGASPVSSGEGARARGAEARLSGAPTPRAERDSAAPGSGPGAPDAVAPRQSQKAAATSGEPAPASSARRGKRASEPAKASEAPVAASPEAVSSRADRARDASPPASAPAAVPPRGAAPAAGAPVSGPPAAPAARSEKRAPAQGAASASPAMPSTRAEPRSASAAPSAREPRSTAPVGAGTAPAAPSTREPRTSGPAGAGTAPAASSARDPRTSGPAGAGTAPVTPSTREPHTTGPAGAGTAPAAPSAREPRTSAPAGAAPSARPEQRSPAPAGASAPAVPPTLRAEPRTPPPGAAAPAAKVPELPRIASARPDKAPASPRVPPVLSESDPSVPTPRPPARARKGQPGAGDAEAASQGAKAMDLMGGEDMDLDSAPVPETRVISWEAPPGRMDPVRRIVRPRPEGTFSAPAPAPGRPAPAKPPEPPPAKVGPGATETREAPAAVSEPSPDTEPNAFRHIRERPLDAKPYRELAEYFDSRGDAARATLMREIADALDSRETPAPRVQRPPLTTDERAGLRHPGLRTPSGELLACTGIALCRLFPAQGRAAGASEPLRASAGPGAPAVLDALHTAARLLDVNLPELVLTEDDGPPFTAVHTGNPRLLVGRGAVRQPLPGAELRFHAGRALLSLSPDLLALRTLKGAQLLRALAVLTTILKDPRGASGPEARVVRESLSPRALERAVALLEPGTRDFDSSALADAARDSANRAGLVACGSVGPALTVLRARRNTEEELVELLRFAASERYLELRAPR